MVAVKARSEITLSAVRDVQATYRYYLLQSSTLSKPSKPTAQPPGGSWNDTEPSYTEGSTNSLYLTDCTVFSDGTYAYSDVSLSSSYEAAKAAYNKSQTAQSTAESAQETADTIQINLPDQLTSITNNCQELILSALESYSTTDDLETLKETISTQLSVMSDNVTISISQTQEQITNVQGDLQAQIVDLSENFQFSSDGMTIGSSAASTMVQLSHGKFSILDGGLEVTYVSDKALYVTDGIFVNSLKVGSFGWVPRTSGNLSFVKF